MAGDSQQRFMHASGPWEMSKIWQCQECTAHGDFLFEDDEAPRKHVTGTGHVVTLTKTTEMTLFPVAFQPPG